MSDITGRRRVAAVQLAARPLSECDDSLERALDLGAQAISAGAELVVFPECTYPGYILGRASVLRDAGVQPFDAVCARFAALARIGATVVVGLAQPGDGNFALNIGAVFLPDGSLAAVSAKRQLWHFDARWFTPGQVFPVTATSVGPLGVLVCADGRQPEIARLLALGGARILADPTALVSNGLETLDSVQWRSLLPLRARENGCWIVAANKCGTEAGAAWYCGGSRVIAPDGSTVAALDTTSEGVLFADIELAAAPSLPRRTPKAYTVLTTATEATTAYGLSAHPRASSHGGFVAACAGLNPNGDWLQEVERAIVSAKLLGARVLAAPSCRLERALWAPWLQLATGLARDDLTIITGCHDQSGGLGLVGLGAGRIVTTELDADGAPSTGGIPDVYDVGGLRLAMIAGEQALVPEVGRCLMLRGADLVVWLPWRDMPGADWLTDGRACENMLYVAMASQAAGGRIAGPSGPLAQTPLGRTHVVISAVSLAVSRNKQVTPGTNALLDRQPWLYAPLCAE